jgi:hypothetical protein
LLSVAIRIPGYVQSIAVVLPKMYFLMS